MISAKLLSHAETISVISVSGFRSLTSRKILDRVVIMLEEQRAYPAPKAQHTILRLLPLLVSETCAVRQMASLLLEHGSLIPEDSFQAFAAVSADLKRQNGRLELVRALKSLFVRCPSLARSKATTSSIPHLVRFLSTDSVAAQRSALDCLFLLTKNNWSWANCRGSSCAIPALQKFMRDGPDEFKEKVGALLTRLPGTLNVTIKGATHLQQKNGGGKPKVYCKVGMEDWDDVKRTGLGVGPTAHWDEQLEWGMDIPHIGKVLQVSVEERHFGQAFVRTGPAVMLGFVSDEFTLNPKAKSGINPAVDVEFKWEALCAKKTNWEEYIM